MIIVGVNEDDIVDQYVKSHNTQGIKFYYEMNMMMRLLNYKNYVINNFSYANVNLKFLYCLPIISAI